MLAPQNVVPLNVPRDLVPTLALRWRLPAASQAIQWTEAGLLLSYNGSLRHVGYRSADYVARILDGANPATMPIELTTVFDLAVHRGTLGQLGLSLPPHVAAQVTRWIE
jgi:putative ABC transport system substrate-binding protein